MYRLFTKSKKKKKKPVSIITFASAEMNALFIQEWLLEAGYEQNSVLG